MQVEIIFEKLKKPLDKQWYIEYNVYIKDIHYKQGGYYEAANGFFGSALY